jgi:hypothetical protein
VKSNVSSRKLRANISTVSITDTSSRAQAVQFEILRAMPGEKRLLMALEMSLFARELAREGIRRDHPGWTETQVARELLRLAFLPEPLPAQLL